MIRSYISAIRAVLQENDIELNENKFLLTSLTRACHLINDNVYTRLPIYSDLLGLIIKKLQRNLHDQPYLSILYCAILSAGYFGLLRIGELTQSPHVILARDRQIGDNKDKILFVLRLSKTHDKGNHPQFVKLTRSSSKTDRQQIEKQKHMNKLIVCPFKLIKRYLEVRKKATRVDEQFFIFSDGSAVCAWHVRNVLKLVIRLIGINPDLYSCHSLRIGRASDLLRMGCSAETVKKIGRWRSNAVFRYFK